MSLPDVRAKETFLGVRLKEHLLDVRIREHPLEHLPDDGDQAQRLRACLPSGRCSGRCSLVRTISAFIMFAYFFQNLCKWFYDLPHRPASVRPPTRERPPADPRTSTHRLASVHPPTRERQPTDTRTRPLKDPRPSTHRPTNIHPPTRKRPRTDTQTSIHRRAIVYPPTRERPPIDPQTSTHPPINPFA